MPFALPSCGPGEVVVEVKAAALNFRDVLKALALYPGEAPDARIFGDEVGGVVTAVGANVKHVQPGDRVFGLAVFGLATQTIARGSDVRRIPDNLSFEEAATIPVVFLTACHALKNVARLRAVEHDQKSEPAAADTQAPAPPTRPVPAFTPAQRTKRSANGSPKSAPGPAD